LTFTALVSPSARRRLVAALGASDEHPDHALLRSAAVIVVPWVRIDEAPESPDRSRSGWELVLLSSGAAIANLSLALHAQGFATAWARGDLSLRAETREALGMDDGWVALGTIAVGRMPPGGDAAPSSPGDVGAHLSER
jgi:nitroreductase